MLYLREVYSYHTDYRAWKPTHGKHQPARSQRVYLYSYPQCHTISLFTPLFTALIIFNQPEVVTFWGVRKRRRRCDERESATILSFSEIAAGVAGWLTRRRASLR